MRFQSIGFCRRKHPSGAKARVFLWLRAARLKPCPDAYGFIIERFRSSEAVPFYKALSIQFFCGFRSRAPSK
jgi:hypothetical protein